MRTEKSLHSILVYILHTISFFEKWARTGYTGVDTNIPPDQIHTTAFDNKG